MEGVKKNASPNGSGTHYRSIGTVGGASLFFIDLNYHADSSKNCWLNSAIRLVSLRNSSPGICRITLPDSSTIRITTSLVSWLT